jgi:hypothetical protein
VGKLVFYEEFTPSAICQCYGGRRDKSFVGIVEFIEFVGPVKYVTLLVL